MRFTTISSFLWRLILIFKTFQGICTNEFALRHNLFIFYTYLFLFSMNIDRKSFVQTKLLFSIFSLRHTCLFWKAFIHWHQIFMRSQSIYIYTFCSLFSCFTLGVNVGSRVCFLDWFMEQRKRSNWDFNCSIHFLEAFSVYLRILWVVVMFL